MARRKLIAGNWKMHKTVAESLALGQAVKAGIKRNDLDVLLAPTSLAIYPLAERLAGAKIMLAAQDIYWQDSGAYTGELSAPLIKAAGASHVLVAHSERRLYFGETEKTANLRLRAALSHGIIPILCIGETLQEREQQQTEDVLQSQLAGAMAGLELAAAAKVVLAYEPVWAIGTGKTATDQQANAAHAYIRAWLAGHFNQDLADNSIILYGGSVKPENAGSLLSQPEVDGALVGGASLKAEDFLAIINAA